MKNCTDDDLFDVIYTHEKTPVDQEWGRSASSLETSCLRLLTLEEVALTPEKKNVIIWEFGKLIKVLGRWKYFASI